MGQGIREIPPSPDMRPFETVRVRKLTQSGQYRVSAVRAEPYSAACKPYRDNNNLR